MIFKKFFKQKPDISSIQVELARRALLEGRFTEAIALFRTGLTLREKIDEKVYFELAEAYFHLGLYKTAAQTLAKTNFSGNELIEKIKSNAENGDEGLKDIPHHTYVRLKILSEHIKRIFGEDLSNVNILDIGGGIGYLACFLPEIKYVLVEPTVNNISALDMPFQKKTFDCVVACHVLEHIEEDMRTAFLDNLCDLAKSNVLLLNPFEVGDNLLDGIAAKSLQMVWEVTGAPWAQEHLECGNPSLDSIREYAKSRNYSLEILANNSYTFTQLYVYMEYFAHVANRQEDLKKINRAFNELDHKMMVNDLFPNDYICFINVDKQ